MTLEIAIVLTLLFVALFLFITNWLRMDVVALLMLCSLALLGLVSPVEAISGFSNPAVITVWAMFIMSEGLTRAGIADSIGRQVTALSGGREIQMIIVIMLISGLLSLGLAMQHSGAATWLADSVLAGLGQYGPMAVLAGLYLVTALGTLVIPTVALVLIMAPIGLMLSNSLGVSGYSAMMVVAVAATSLASPISHAANTLVMGPGGYRFVDYLKVGGPLSIVLFIITMMLVPIVWPLTSE